MTDLEQRVRAGLSELADGLPPSEGGWAEHQRRLARHRRTRWRAPALVAAAAVVLVSAVAVTTPALLGRPGDGTGQPAGTPGPSSQATPPATPRDSPQAPSSPVVTPPQDSPPPSRPALSDGALTPRPLAKFTEGGDEWEATAFTMRQGDGTELVCVVGVPAGQPLDGPTQHPYSRCTTPFLEWTPGHVRQVETLTVLGGPTLESGPLVGLMVFVTRPAVDRLEVRAGQGSPVSVHELGRNGNLSLYVADFHGSTQGFGYTAWDAAGNVVESAIT